MMLSHTVNQNKLHSKSLLDSSIDLNDRGRSLSIKVWCSVGRRVPSASPPLSPLPNPQMCCVPGYVSGYAWHVHACVRCPLYSLLLPGQRDHTHGPVRPRSQNGTPPDATAAPRCGAPGRPPDPCPDRPDTGRRDDRPGLVRRDSSGLSPGDMRTELRGMYSYGTTQCQ